MSERFLIAGSLRLDLHDQRLFVNGAPVRLGGRALALLRALMERPQILVTKDELFDRVWPGVTVSEAVLTTAVKEVRQAIGEQARQPRYIETAHGRGYRFLQPVERSDGAAPLAARASIRPAKSTVGSERGSPHPVARVRRPLWIVLVVMVGLLGAGAIWLGSRPDGRVATPVAASAIEKSIVVLPFEDLSPDGEQRWFADGLVEEVQTSLARTPDLRVMSRTSAAGLSRSGLTGPEVATRLNAAQFVEGSVRRSGDRVRVTAKLVRASDGAELWSQNYDRDLRDVISIQEDLAFEIASALKTVMEPGRLRVMVAAGTRSVNAYEAYLRGLSLDQRQFEDGDPAYALAAAEAYERARVLDPNFAAAHWKAAQTWFGNQTRVDASTREGTPEVERLARYFERVDAAIATSRDETERLKYRAGRASIGLQFSLAHRLMAAYLEARPRDIDAWEEMADLSAYAGERGWMRRAAERIHALSVEEGNPRSRAITVSVMSLDLDNAVARAHAQIALRPDQALTQYQAHRALIWSGNLAEARQLLPRIQASRMSPINRSLAELRQACAEGRPGDAAMIRARIDRDGDIGERWQAAQIAGEPDVAVELLRPLDRPDRLPNLMQYLIHPTFDPAAYPALQARLVQNGVADRQVILMPFACRADSPARPGD